MTVRATASLFALGSLDEERAVSNRPEVLLRSSPPVNISLRRHLMRGVRYKVTLLSQRLGSLGLDGNPCKFKACSLLRRSFRVRFFDEVDVAEAFGHTVIVPHDTGTGYGPKLGKGAMKLLLLEHFLEATDPDGVGGLAVSFSCHLKDGGPPHTCTRQKVSAVKKEKR